MDEPRRVAMTLVQCWHRVPGGTATGVLGVARSLVASGRVDLVGVGPKHRSLPGPPFTPSVPTVALPLPRLLLYDSWHHLRWPAVQVATGPVDVVHATALTVPPTGGAPLVVTVHDLFPLTHPEQSTARGARVTRRAWELLRRNADLVVVPSEATRADCVAHGLEVGRLRVVPYGVSTTLATDSAVAEVRRTHGLHRPFVLWVGTVEPRKNLPVLLDAFALLSDLDVDLVLVGPPGWGTQVGEAAAAMGDRVRRLGFVPEAELFALRRAAAVCCYPSLREGFGLPVLEAMAQGTPVVTSLGTSTAEVAAGAGLLVRPTDHVAVAGALRDVLTDPDLAKHLGDAGRERVLACYSWDSCAQGHLAAYAEVAP